MSINTEIYLIGLAVLIFLIIVFLFLRNIANAGKLKVKIESVNDSFEENDIDLEAQNQKSFDFEEPTKVEEQELSILNLISIDRSLFDINQIFGFLKNYGAQIESGYFSITDEEGKEKFKIINALTPGTFEIDTETFAIVVVSNLNALNNPIEVFKEMIQFAITFSEKFDANVCDQDRTPITKQMISHMESKAQEITRLRQLNQS